MVETSSLENCYVRKGIEGSNPSASALPRSCPARTFYISKRRRDPAIGGKNRYVRKGIVGSNPTPSAIITS